MTPNPNQNRKTLHKFAVRASGCAKGLCACAETNKVLTTDTEKYTATKPVNVGNWSVKKNDRPALQSKPVGESNPVRLWPHCYFNRWGGRCQSDLRQMRPVARIHRYHARDRQL